ncbi:hypothetical protein HK102_002950 [Quaeritorhiza haematococci]|nr:hypothetical protein HK102_002950 [Quaeritorhiza haematococci]
MTVVFRLDDEQARAEGHLGAVANALRKSKRSVVITGAGISVSGGIPDFRSSDGLYNLVKEKFPSVVVKGQDLFDATLFKDPVRTSIFYTFMAELKGVIDKANVTPTHQFLKRLDDDRKLLRCYTQNIDCLEARLSLSVDIADKRSVKVVQLHGDLDHVVCTICNSLFEFSTSVQVEFREGSPPPCPSCQEQESIRSAMGKRALSIGILRPNITLYNEHHSRGDKIADVTSYDLKRRPDLLIIMGTSLKVVGVKRLVKDLANTVHELKNGKVIFINKTEIGLKEWEGVIDYCILSDSDSAVEALESEMQRLEELAEAKKQAQLAKASLKVKSVSDKSVSDGTPSVAMVFKKKKNPAKMSVKTDQEKKQKKGSKAACDMQSDDVLEHFAIVNRENTLPSNNNDPIQRGRATTKGKSSQCSTRAASKDSSKTTASSKNGKKSKNEDNVLKRSRANSRNRSPSAQMSPVSETEEAALVCAVAKTAISRTPSACRKSASTSSLDGRTTPPMKPSTPATPPKSAVKQQPTAQASTSMAVDKPTKTRDKTSVAGRLRSQRDKPIAAAQEASNDVAGNTKSTTSMHSSGDQTSASHKTKQHVKLQSAPARVDSGHTIDLMMEEVKDEVALFAADSMVIVGDSDGDDEKQGRCGSDIEMEGVRDVVVIKEDVIDIVSVDAVDPSSSTESVSPTTKREGKKALLDSPTKKRKIITGVFSDVKPTTGQTNLDLDRSLSSRPACSNQARASEESEKASAQLVDAPKPAASSRAPAKRATASKTKQQRKQQQQQQQPTLTSFMKSTKAGASAQKGKKKVKDDSIVGGDKPPGTPKKAVRTSSSSSSQPPSPSRSPKHSAEVVQVMHEYGVRTRRQLAQLLSA